ncbi:survival of motor neuron protein isoform X2 [Kryptolebias marmoratus]|uniref:survival of motor neuron protein isoform X2 n=1 Tax=Kryptolebias marmoratus TaxID=37003 RepID=UPI0018ACCC5F|nr:survival of motor neuron protein isoform X2 [Kryptolebias marmoratus]
MTENHVLRGTGEQEDCVPEEAAVQTETEETSATAEISLDVEPEMTDETKDKLKLEDEDRWTTCPPAEDTSGTEVKETTVFRFVQDWKPGSRCRAVYSEDGLVYPAEVLWVKGQRCRVRYDDYNNEEELDVSGLLSPNELHGPSRTAAATKGSSWRSGPSSGNADWRRQRRGENQVEQGGERRSAWRNDQKSSTMKERPGSQNKMEEEANEKGGNQQKDEPTNNSVPPFPPFPPPPRQMGSAGPSSFFLPPPPPSWAFCGGHADGSPDDGSVSNMLMLWYLCGFLTGSFMVDPAAVQVALQRLGGKPV